MNKIIEEVTTWDDIKKNIGFVPEDLEDDEPEKPRYVQEIYEEVGSFPFKVRKVVNNRGPTTEHVEVGEVGHTCTILGYMDDPGEFDYNGPFMSLIDTKSWILID